MLGQAEQDGYADEMAADAQPQAPRFQAGGANGSQEQFCARCYWHWTLHKGDRLECPPPGSINLGGG